MDFSRQAPRAAKIHNEYLLSGKATCIDCHKGIAHELPDMTGVEPGWIAPENLQGDKLPGARPDEEATLRKYLAERVAAVDVVSR